MTASDRVGDMTHGELRQIIKEIVDERLGVWPRPKNRRPIKEVIASIDKHRWTPPPGSPSTLQLLREDRDA